MKKIRKKDIERWLKRSNEKAKMVCPREAVIPCEFCERLFPKIVKTFTCPCDTYKLSYVRSRAQRYLNGNLQHLFDGRT